MTKLCIVLANIMVCILLASPMQATRKIDDLTDGQSYTIVIESCQMDVSNATIDNGNHLGMQKGFFDMIPQHLAGAFNAAHEVLTGFLIG